jgi:chromosome partitioning protein
MAKLAVFNCKGGVGKTTTALNLGAALARSGKQVCLIDMDPQAHLTRVFGKLPDTADASVFALYSATATLRNLALELPDVGLLVPAHGQLTKVDSMFGKGPATLNRLRQGLASMEIEYPAHYLIDCCPFVGVLSLSSIFAATGVLVPVSSDYLSLQGALQIEQVLNSLEPVLKRKMPRRYLLTRYDKRRNMSEDIRARMAEAFGDRLCRTVIAENVSVAMSPAQGKDVFSYQPGCKGAQDYQALREELQAGGFLAD